MKQLCLRLSDEDVSRLDVLASAFGLTKSDYLRQSINADYDKLNGNPELKAAVEQIKALSESLKALK